jgi:hypothetical protein
LDHIINKVADEFLRVPDKLYHYTSLFGLLRILDDGYIHHGKFDSVSMTSNSNFHNVTRIFVNLDARIVLDGNKISRKYEVVPFDYYSDKDDDDIGLGVSKDEDEWKANTDRLMLNGVLIKVDLMRGDKLSNYVSGSNRVKIENLLEREGIKKWDEEATIELIEEYIEDMVKRY